MKPAHALPGYRCDTKEYFPCNNGVCVKKHLVCDGDEDCADGSDERRCKCLSAQFTCLTGECVSLNKLCDGTENCEDGSDELRCGE